MTKEGRLARGKENYNSKNKRLLKNSETLEYITTLKPEKSQSQSLPTTEKSVEQGDQPKNKQKEKKDNAKSTK